jgi:hypothetical protein
MSLEYVNVSLVHLQSMLVHWDRGEFSSVKGEF